MSQSVHKGGVYQRLQGGNRGIQFFSYRLVASPPERCEIPQSHMRTDNILVVEDEKAFAQVVELYLKRLGYHVSGVADNGGDALNLAAEHRPSLALLDIEIQGNMDGL